MMEQTKSTPRLRCLCNANAPWATSGYAVQTELLMSRMRKDKYELALCNFYGQEGGILRINDVVMYPKMANPWGDDALVWHAKDFKADVTFTLQDIWTMNEANLRQIPRWIPICPIDHDPPPPRIIELLKMAYRVITYSKFGHDIIEKFGLYSTYIPHGVDTKVLKPMENKEELRKKIGIPPNLFIFGMVAANKDMPPRKSFQEAIDAFKTFHDKYPDSGMFFHTFLSQNGGFPIEQYWKFIGLPADRLFFINPYDMMFHVGRSEMAQVYNCFDCLLLPSTNEGFGVPAIEAQSCGVPVIVNNFTSMPELIIKGKTGLACEVGYKRFSPMGSYVGVPDVISLTNCMFEIYKKDREKMSQECRKWIVENYDMDLIYETKWRPFLYRLEKEIYPPELPTK